MHTLTVTELVDAHDTSDNQANVIATETFILWADAVVRFAQALAQYGAHARRGTRVGAKDNRYLRADLMFDSGSDVLVELRHA